jgi:hypothetical protein
MRPGVSAADLGDANEQQGEPAEHVVGADPLLLAVIDRPHVDDPLHVEPGRA